MEIDSMKVQENIGTKRARATALYSIIIGIFSAVIILLSILGLLYLVLGNFYILTLLIVGFIVGYEYFLRKKSKYYSYYISSEEYENLKSVRLIHYSNTLNKDDYEYYLKTGLVRLHAKRSAAKNYVMQFKDKRKKYIWFHQEEINGEPSFASFFFTHSGEDEPRKYKIIMDLNRIPQERILLRPDNQNIIVIGDLEIPGTIETNFNFYNHKLYFWYSIKHKLELLNGIKVIYTGFHQFYGKVIDHLDAKNIKNKK